MHLCKYTTQGNLDCCHPVEHFGEGYCCEEVHVPGKKWKQYKQPCESNLRHCWKHITRDQCMSGPRLCEWDSRTKSCYNKAIKTSSSRFFSKWFGPPKFAKSISCNDTVKDDWKFLDETNMDRNVNYIPLNHQQMSEFKANWQDPKWTSPLLKST